MAMTQRTRFKLSVYVLLLIIALIMIGWGWSVSLAYQRDSERLADMNILRVRWLDYVHRYATYQPADCTPGMVVNECRGNDQQPFDLSDIVDPVSEGRLQYVVDVVTTDTFAVRFALEQGMAGLSRGEYVMTPDGVKR